MRLMSMKLNKYLKGYIDFELMNGRAPHSELELCKSKRWKEETFFEKYKSLQHLRKAILQEVLRSTTDLLSEDDNYPAFNSREKMLALFYTLFEEMKGLRSYLLTRYSTMKDNFYNKEDWADFKTDFRARTNAIIEEGLSTEEIQSRPVITNQYHKGFDTAFAYVFKMWISDTTDEFQTTDAAIEKSVNLGYELMSKGALDAILDFGKFAFKNRAI